MAVVVDGRVTGEGGSANTLITNDIMGKVVTFSAAQPGANFLVKVQPGQTTTVGYNLEVTVPPPGVPGNDLCASAQDLTLPAPGAAPLLVHGSTVGATNNFAPSTPGCTGPSTYPANPTDVFYRFTSPATAVTVTAATSGTPDPDTVLYLLEGGCAGTEVACNDDLSVGTGASSISRTLMPNTSYILVVDSWHDPLVFDLRLTTAP